MAHDLSSSLRALSLHSFGVYNTKSAYVIESKNAPGKFLNVSGGSKDDGGKIHLWDDPQNLQTQWYIRPTGDGTYNIISANSGKCLNVYGGSHDNGAKIHQWGGPGDTNSRFHIDAKGGGHVCFRSATSGKVINVSGGSTDKGADIHQWDNPDSPESQWRIKFIRQAAHSFSNPHVRFTIASANAPGKFLNVAGASGDNGAKIVLWHDASQANSQWHIRHAGGDKYYLVSAHSGKSVNVSGNGTHNGADVIQWENSGGQNSQFRIAPVGGGRFTLQAAHSGKYLNVSGASKDDGAKIHQWDDPQNLQTQWLITPIVASELATPGRAYAIQNRNADGKYLNVEGKSRDNGAKIVLWHNPSEPNSQWFIKPAGGGTFHIVSVHSGKALNVSGAGQQNGAELIQWDIGGQNGQFRINSAGGGAFTLQAAHSNKYVNVSGRATNDGAKIHQWDDPDNHATQWTIHPIV